MRKSLFHDLVIDYYAIVDQLYNLKMMICFILNSANHPHLEYKVKHCSPLHLHNITFKFRCVCCILSITSQTGLDTTWRMCARCLIPPRGCSARTYGHHQQHCRHIHQLHCLPSFLRLPHNCCQVRTCQFILK